ncbi:hypothetical protein AXF42_Ash000244 [Apostasia shenzhenica]|uniref:Uncharacterized protein n=1 Tax=Apostasia shenzhenica TaxID=1088818 RepID=A0A2I0AFV0_9ASPA|nr:hypothetical protein AXF42_Ash000244 [Apostasia shenzhenica]
MTIEAHTNAVSPVFFFIALNVRSRNADHSRDLAVPEAHPNAISLIFLFVALTLTSLAVPIALEESLQQPLLCSLRPPFRLLPQAQQATTLLGKTEKEEGEEEKEGEEEIERKGKLERILSVV